MSISWAVQPPETPFGPLSATLRRVVDQVAVEVLFHSELQPSGTFQWSLVGEIRYPPSPGGYWIQISDGVTSGHSPPFVIEDPAFNVTLPLGFTLFRWFSVPVDIVPITELPEGFVVDVYLCVNRTDAAPLEMGDCPWMVFQSLSTNGSYPLQVSLTLLTNATFLQEAPKAGLSVVVVVGNANSQWIVIGQSLDLSLLDVVSNVRVLGASGTSLVYNRFPGWELVWDIHPAAGPTIGDLLLVFPLYRRSTPGGGLAIQRLHP